MAIRGRQMVNELVVPSGEWASPKEARKVYLFWLGFVIYTGAYILAKAMPNLFDKLILVQAVGGVFFLPAAINLITFRYQSNYTRVLFFLCFAWALGIIGRGWPLTYDEILYFLFDAWNSVLLYFVPFVALFPRNIRNLRRLFDVIGLLSIIFIVFSFLFRGVLLNPDGENLTSQGMVEYFSKTLALPSAFLLMTYIYHNRTRKYLAAGVLALTLVLAAIRARRGLMFMTATRLLAVYLFFSMSIAVGWL